MTDKTLVDRVVSYFNPIAGAKRMQARHAMALAGGYTGASKSRRATSGWTTTSNDADGDLLPDLPELRNRSRDLIRNNPLALGAMNTKTTNIVGTGLRVRSTIDDEFLGLSEEQAELWENAAEREFNYWADSIECDLTRKKNFAGLQDLALFSSLEAGDCFALMVYKDRPGSEYDLKVQLIEADRVTNKDNESDSDRLSGGIKTDVVGAPVELHVLKSHPGNMYFKDEEWETKKWFTNSGRPNVLHVVKTRRIGLSRGAPDLAPVIEPLKQLGRYTEAELMAAVVSGMFTVFITSETGESDLRPMTPDSSQSQSQANDEYELGNGALVDLAEGEKVSTANPGRPNSGFDPFVLAILRQIGVGLEIPYELLIKHYTASYSASRAALLEAWKTFKSRRKWFADCFCQPIYERLIDEAVMSGRLVAPGYLADPRIRAAYLGTKWVGDAPGQLDPLKEVNAAKIRVDEDFSTRSDETIEINGGDFEKNVRRRGREEKLRREHETVMLPEMNEGSQIEDDDDE